MKILYHHRTRSKDGQAVHIEELIRALRARGCEVIVVEPRSARGTAFGAESNTLALARRCIPRALYELLELGYSIVAYQRLRKAYLTHRPDILYERHNLFLTAGAWLHRRYGVPYLLEINGPLYAERKAHGGLSLERLARWSERHAWQAADYALPVTGVLAGLVEQEGVARERLRVIPNGIDPHAFATAPDTETAKAKLGLQGKSVLGFTGFVREWHALDRVIEFLARYPDPACMLFVVGDGPVRADLETLAARHGLRDRVRFTGVVPRDAIPAHVASFDVALQPAATSYASPLKLFEYMVLGRAIIAPAQPNLLEVLTDGENALLFDPAVPDALEVALARVLSDPALRSRLGEGARRTIEARQYTWDGNAQRVIELGEMLVRSAHVPQASACET